MVTRYDFLFSKSFALSANKPPFIRLLYTGNFFRDFNQRYKLLAIQIESPNCNTSRCNSRVTAIKFSRKRKPCYFNLHSGQTFQRKGHFPSENINLIFRWLMIRWPNVSFLSCRESLSAIFSSYNWRRESLAISKGDKNISLFWLYFYTRLQMH